MEKAARIDLVRKQQATEVLCLLKKVSPQHEPEAKVILGIVNPSTDEEKKAAAKNVPENKAKISAMLTTIVGDIKANAESRKKMKSEAGQASENEIIATVLKALDPPSNSEPKRIWHVTIRPQARGKKGDPLSWKLAPTQKAEIENNWNAIRTNILKDKNPAAPRDEIRRLTPAQLRYFFTRVADLVPG